MGALWKDSGFSLLYVELNYTKKSNVGTSEYA